MTLYTFLQILKQLSNTSSLDSLETYFIDIAFHLTWCITIIMVQKSYDKKEVDWQFLLDTALDDLRWIYPNVKMIVASNKWRNKATIKNLDQSY